MERSDPPSPKRQKTEEETACYDGRPEDFDSDECTDEDMQLFDQELDMIGGVGDVDFFLCEFHFSFFVEIDLLVWFVGFWNRLQKISLLFWLETTGSGW